MSPKTSNNGFVFPVYLYPEAETNDLFSDVEPITSERRPNLSADFIAAIEKAVGLNFITDGMGGLDAAFGPEDVLAYVFAVLYSPSYRQRYAQFLKTDFPRIPLPDSPMMFTDLVELGRSLIAVYSLPVAKTYTLSFPVAGNNRVDKVERKGERVYINSEQFFEGVEEANWTYFIGGYQVMRKWLNDRKGRLLTFDELDHYRRIDAAITEMRAIQKKIDLRVPVWV